MDMWGAAELAEDMCCFIVQRVLETRMEELKPSSGMWPSWKRFRSRFHGLAMMMLSKFLRTRDMILSGVEISVADEETTISNQNERPTILLSFPCGS